VNAFAQPSAAPIAGPHLDNRRVLAAVIDLLVIVAGGFVLGLVTGLLAGEDAEFGPGLQAVTVAWALYYYFALESGAGQTLGKKVMKLRVVRADGGPVGIREVAVRTVLRVVDGLFLYLVGLVVMLATGQRRQRLGDLAAGTVVADASATSAPQAAAATATAPAVAAPGALDEREEPAHFEPPAHTPVDVGAPLDGLTAPEAPEVPEVHDFEPFATPAEATFPEEPQAEVQYAQDAPAEEPEADFASDLAAGPDEEPAEPSSTDWPHMYAARAHAAEAASQPEEEDLAPASEDEPPAPAPEAEQFAAVTEDEPAAPTPEAEQFAAVSEDEPAAPAPEEEPAAPAPQEEYSRPDELQGPDLSAAPVEDSESAEPVEDLRADAARAAEHAVEAESEVPGLPGSPVEEPVDAEAPAPAPPTEAETPAEDADEDAEDVTVRSVETVSAIDLIMSGAEDEGTDSADGDSGEDAPDEPSGSGDEPAPGGEPPPRA
jgi:uncharacterized RDD family membrane protein YckC